MSATAGSSKRIGSTSTGNSKAGGREAPPKLQGAALAKWLDARVSKELVGHAAAATATMNGSPQLTNVGDAASVITGNFLPIWCFISLEGRAIERAKELLKRNGPVKAVALPLDERTGLATASWSSCVVTAVEDGEARSEMAPLGVIVSWTAGKRVGAPIAHACLVCLDQEDALAFARRLQVGIAARARAEALLRQSLFVESMPISTDMQLDSATISNIFRRTFSSPSVPTDAGTSALLDEVNGDYTHTMNKLVFEANVQDLVDEVTGVRLPTLSILGSQ